MRLFEMTVVVLDPSEKGFDEWAERLDKHPHFSRVSTNSIEVCYVDRSDIFNAEEVLDEMLRSSHEMGVC